MRPNGSGVGVGHSKHRKAFGKKRGGNMRACLEWLESQKPKRRKPRMYGSIRELMERKR